MSRIEYEIIIRGTHPVVPVTGLSLSELCRRCDCHVTVMRRMVDAGLIEPLTTGGEPLFDHKSVLRIRKALRIKRDLRLNLDAVVLVMELLDRIEQLERRR